MKKMLVWMTVTMTLLLLSSEIFACGNAMIGERKNVFTVETAASLILFILPIAIPWLIGKPLFYINKMAQNTDFKDKKKLIVFFLIPWIPVLIISAIIWFVIVEYLLRAFFGYSYSTDTFVAVVIVAYLLMTLFIYKVFHLTPFSKKA